MAGQAQFPGIVQVVLEADLQQLVVVADLAVVGLAEKGRVLDRAHLAVDGGNATVEHRVGARELAVDHQQGVGRQLPTEGRVDDLSLVADMIAKTAVVFDCQVDPRKQGAVLVQRRVDVEAAAVAIPASGAGLELGEGFQLRAFGDDVDQPAGIATAVEGRRWSLEHFQALDGRYVRRAVAAAVDGKTVAVQLAGGEAAHAVVEEGQAAEVVLPRNAASEIQGSVDTAAAEIVQHLGGYHTDGLGNFADRGVGAGGTG